MYSYIILLLLIELTRILRRVKSAEATLAICGDICASLNIATEHVDGLLNLTEDIV